MRALFLAALGLAGCGDDDGGATSATGTTGSSSSSSSVTGSGGAGAASIPTGAELVTWLEAGSYTGWTAESAIHDSTGPHFGGVRTFVNAELEASLTAESASHPAGAAAVKELYGDGNEIVGWSVSTKLADDSAAGQNWYWYERFGSSVYSDGNGTGLCVNCHSAGVDFFRSPVPLQ